MFAYIVNTSTFLHCPLSKNNPNLERRKSKLSYVFYSRSMREYNFKNVKMSGNLNFGRNEE